MQRSQAALSIALAALLAGCTPPETRDDRTPRPPPAATRPPGQPPPAQQQQPPPAPAPAAPDSSPREPSPHTARLSRDLDSPDTDRVFFATVTLLSEWATNPQETAGLSAIAAHLKTGTPEQQRTLVKAIRDFHALPGATDADKKRAAPGLVPLLEPLLGSPEPTLRRGAVDALAAIDALWTDDAAGNEVDAMITRVQQVRRSAFELVSAIRLIGRKPVKFAVPRLLDAIERFSAWGEVEAAAFEELHAATGQDFGHDLQAARDWWAKNADRRPDEWFRERLAKSEDETNRARMAARTYWQRYVTSLVSDPGLFHVLQETLSAEKCEIPQIRADAGRQLADMGTPAAYQALIDALKTERDRDVTRQLLDDVGTMARTPPDEPDDLRRAAVETIAPRLTDVDKDVRIAAINALAYVGLDQALPPILACLRGRGRNADVVLAVFQAVSRLGVKGNPGAVAQVLAFFKDEWARDAKDPARDPRIFRECANTLKSLAQRKEITAGSPDAPAVLAVLLQLLDFEESGNAVAPSTRQFAAIALGKLGMASALAPLERRLDEKVEPDAGVAAYAASAIGEIAAAPDVKQADRDAALAALRAAFDVRRDPQFKDAAFDAARALLALDPGALTGFVSLTDKLAQANDWPRLVKLLKETLPEKPPVGAEAVHAALRERLAAVLAQSGKVDEAEKTLADLLRTATPDSSPRLWTARAALVKRLLDGGDQKGAASLGAQILSGTGPLAPPPEIVAQLKRTLEPAASPQQPRPEGHSTGTVPTGLAEPADHVGGAP